MVRSNLCSRGHWIHEANCVPVTDCYCIILMGIHLKENKKAMVSIEKKHRHLRLLIVWDARNFVHGSVRAQDRKNE